MSQSRDLLFPILMFACCTLPTANAAAQQCGDEAAAARPRHEPVALLPVHDPVDYPALDADAASREEPSGEPTEDPVVEPAEPQQVVPGRDHDPVTPPQVGPGLLPPPELEMAYSEDGELFEIQVGAPMDYLGLVLLAPSPAMTRITETLPPLLIHGVPTVIAKSQGGVIAFHLPHKGPELAVWGQALILAGDVLLSSDIATAGPTELDR